MPAQGTSARPYQGRTAVLATKHQKEKVVAGPLQEGAGIVLHVPPDLDTDSLGTFTGEVERLGTPRSVAIKKARMGMAASGLRLGLANEGSFGPHPTWPMAAADHELLVFLDDDEGLEIVEWWLSAETNFSHAAVHPGDEIRDFLDRVQFPSHGLIVRPNSGLQEGFLWKGIVTQAMLEEAVARAAAASADGLAHVESDMRAHVNPSRQKVLHHLAERLASRLASQCPRCRTVGWGLVDVVRGLPCERCGHGTELIAAEVFGCVRCDYRESAPPRSGVRVAPAADCDWCNP